MVIDDLFVCAKCHRPCSPDMGCDDEQPDVCDDCYEAKDAQKTVMFRDGCDTFENRELVRSNLKVSGV
jgi:hypothetical protein